MANKLVVNPIIWSPSEDRINSSEMYKFMKAINTNYNIALKSYDDLHKWSTKFKPYFWESIWDFFDIIGSKGEKPYINPLNKMPESKFFPYGTVNYAENMLSGNNKGLAIVFKSEDKIRRELTWKDLKNQVQNLVEIMESIIKLKN